MVKVQSDKKGLSISSFVSVIIPVFNVAPYLCEALESVLHQTYENLEIIIIDDGSDDDSGRICDEYAWRDQRVTVIHQKNRGLSSARNVGLNWMSSEIVAFLDSDDAFRPTFIEEMLFVMVKQKADMVLCGFSSHKTTGKMSYTGQELTLPMGKAGMLDRITALQAFVNGSINATVWNKVYRRELWGDIRFPAGHNYEDLWIMYKVLDRCRSCFVLDKQLYLYRIRPQSITHTFSWKNVKDRLQACSNFDSFIELNTPEIFSAKQLHRIHQLRLEELIYLYIHYSDIRESENGYSVDELRRMIIERGRGTDILSFRLRTIIAYGLIRTYPGLVRWVYLFYRIVRTPFRSLMVKLHG